MFRTLLNQMPSLTRYSLAMIGPIGSSAAQFLLQLVLLGRLDPAGFGKFSLIMILIQLSWGLCGALLCAPLPQLLSLERASVTSPALVAIFSGNLLSACGALLLFLAIGLLLGMAPFEIVSFAGFAALALLRWFARSYAYAAGEPLRTTLSDLVYGATVLLGTAVVWSVHAEPLTLAGSFLTGAAAIGMIPFGRVLLRNQFGSLSMAQLPAYRGIWRQHGRWALLGVATTELTANAHAYLITLWLGPRAFAPVAATALLIRPTTVAMNALTEFERARFARDIGRGRIDEVAAAVRFGRVVLLAGWAATTVAVIALLAISPYLIFPRHYDIGLLTTGAILWLIVAGVRVAKVPDSALLQAAAEFRPLAMASVWSSLLSLATVVPLLATVGTIWSILGILAGEFVYAIAVWRTARRWWIGVEAKSCPA